MGIDDLNITVMKQLYKNTLKSETVDTLLSAQNIASRGCCENSVQRVGMMSRHNKIMFTIVLYDFFIKKLAEIPLFYSTCTISKKNIYGETAAAISYPISPSKIISQFRKKIIAGRYTKT